MKIKDLDIEILAFQYSKNKKRISKNTIEDFVAGFKERDRYSFKEQIDLLLKYANSQDRITDAEYGDVRGETYTKYRTCNCYWKDIQKMLEQIKNITDKKEFW